MQVLKDNVDYIEEVGGLGYDILKPVLIMANAETLIRIEDTNPHLMEDTAEVRLRGALTLNELYLFSVVGEVCEEKVL